jgi:hypothetical protein
VVRAFAVVRDGFDMADLFAGLDALDNKIDGQLQLDLYGSVSRLISIASAWDLKNGDDASPLGVQIDALRQARRTLRPKIVELAPPAMGSRARPRRQNDAAGVKAIWPRACRDWNWPNCAGYRAGRQQGQGRHHRRRESLFRGHRSLPHRPYRGCREGPLAVGLLRQPRIVACRTRSPPPGAALRSRR